MEIDEKHSGGHFIVDYIVRCLMIRLTSSVIFLVACWEKNETTSVITQSDQRFPRGGFPFCFGPWLCIRVPWNSVIILQG